MKIGDLVRVARLPKTIRQDWIGVVVVLEGWMHRFGFDGVVVYWNDKYPDEVENKCDLEVISENR